MLKIDQNILQSEHSKRGFFRYKELKKGVILLTNDMGQYCFLSEEQFLAFLQDDYSELGDKYKELGRKGFIKLKNTEEFLTLGYAKKHHYIGQGPSLHMIVTTLRCNHHCQYCHAAVAPLSATEYDMTVDTAKKVLDTIFFTNSNSITIEFQGGESLLNIPVIEYILKEGKKKALLLGKNVNFSLVTNLTLMTEKTLDWLLREGVDICTSLDGDIHNHNKNRTGYDGNSFERVTYWIQYINKEFQRRGTNQIIPALLTVTAENLPHYKEIIDAYAKLGLKSIFLRWLNPYGFAASDLKKLAYTKEDWVEFYKKSMQYLFDLNKGGADIKESITTVFLKKILSEYDPGFMDIRNPGALGVGCIAYNYDGKVYASDESRMLGRMGIQDFLLTDMRETGEETYKAAIMSDITFYSLKSSCLDGLPLYNDHVYKPYMGVDIIHNFKSYGNFFQAYKLDDKAYMQEKVLDFIFEKLYENEKAGEQIYFKNWI